MKTIKTIILSLTCLAMVSCDFLDKEPTKLTPDNYFNNADEALSFLTSVYAPLTSQNFYGNEYMFMTGADDLSIMVVVAIRKPAVRLPVTMPIQVHRNSAIFGKHSIRVSTVPIRFLRILTKAKTYPTNCSCSTQQKHVSCALTTTSHWYKAGRTFPSRQLPPVV